MMSGEDYREMMDEVTSDLAYDCAMSLADGDPQAWEVLGLKRRVQEIKAGLLAKLGDEIGSEWKDEDEFWRFYWERVVEEVLMCSAWGNKWGIDSALRDKLIKARI